MVALCQKVITHNASSIRLKGKEDASAGVLMTVLLINKLLQKILGFYMLPFPAVLGNLSIHS